MSTVNVDNLKVDMVLADDVTDSNNRLLLAKGQKIESKHIRILKIWGITETNVVGRGKNEEILEIIENPENPENPENNDKPEVIERIKENTKYVFKHVDLTHPAIKELFRLSVLHRSHNNIFTSDKNITLPQQDDPKSHSKKDVGKIFGKKDIKLPEIPKIIFELNDIVSDPLATACDIACIVDKSPSLAALLLKIVNSSVYGFPSKIDTISRAVAIIGTREITSLALGISTINIFKDIPKEILDMNSFLRHSFACGIISRIFAASKNIPQTEQLFVSGLLHDIGRLIIYKYFQDRAKTLLNSAIESDKLLYKLENSYLGSNHTLIGKSLLQKWNLPVLLVNSVFYHHNPSRAQDPVMATIVHLADIIVNGLGLGSSGERFVPTLDYEAWDNIGILPGSFENVVQQTTHQLVSLEAFFHN